MTGGTSGERWRITVTGAVQGVGFRPFVYRLASEAGLAGWVANTGAGVAIEAEGPEAALSSFIRRLRTDAPAAAHVHGVARECVPLRGERGFAVTETGSAGAGALPVPDRATCDACRDEVLDPAERRWRHPFASCAACGPRYTIVARLPWDRPATAMHGFALCPFCAAEHGAPADRRFHAETLACPACGPRIALLDRTGTRVATEDDALRRTGDLVRDGAVVAIKGIGGYHLVVRADDDAALRRLRERKRRPRKPFAVMFPGIAAVEAACDLRAEERAALLSSAAPIVLVRKRPAASGLSALVAPELTRIGALLPYTPLHHLLARDLALPLVCTSANRSDEPIVWRDADAPDRLGGIAAALLTHDRPILRPAEDSVLQVVGGTVRALRLGRGLAPVALPLAGPMPAVLALGGHLKAALGVSRGDQAVLGPHLGDLDTPEALDALEAAAVDLPALVGVQPVALACDRHPDYATTRFAERSGLRVIRVQHHAAHVLACAAEHGVTGPILGIAWDGTGYGGDGTVWGGEMLRVEGTRVDRVAHLLPFRLPGGEAAVREPRRAAIGLLAALVPDDAALLALDLPPLAAFRRDEAAALVHMVRAGLNAPVTSSAGRLLDAVAALLGLCQVASHEAEAPMALETLAERTNMPAEPYPMGLGGSSPTIVDWRPAITTLLADLASGIDRSIAAARFYAGLGDAAVAVAQRAGLPMVALTGGCFQSPYLSAFIADRLARAGFDVLQHVRVPPGDGGLALGQLEWARRALATEE